MAGYDLIEAYLDELRRRMRWRPDVDDVVAEAADHLISAAERYQALGDGTDIAQGRALDHFGEPELVALAFAATPNGGLIVPTKFTRTAGVLAMVGAACWLLVPLTWWPAGFLPPVGDVERNLSGIVYGIGYVALFAAGILTMTVMVALNQRHGGLGAAGTAGPLLVAAGIVASVIAAVFIGWGLLMLVGTAVAALAMLDRDLAPRLPTIAFGGGLAAGAGIWALLRGIDGSLLVYSGLWGDYWVANLAGITAGATILAVGLAGLGRWLHREQPAPMDEPGQPLRA